VGNATARTKGSHSARLVSTGRAQAVIDRHGRNPAGKRKLGGHQKRHGIPAPRNGHPDAGRRIFIENPGDGVTRRVGVCRHWQPRP
jgi:hypothetical protein